MSEIELFLGFLGESFSFDARMCYVLWLGKKQDLLSVLCKQRLDAHDIRNEVNMG